MRSIVFAVVLAVWTWALPVRATDLLEAWRSALQQEPRFLMAQASLRAAREELPKARAGLLPNLTLSSSYARNATERTSSGFLGQPVTANFDYTSQNHVLSLRQPIYRKQPWVQLAQAEAQVASAEAQLIAERNGLALRVAEAYFSALLAEDQASLAAAEMKRYEVAMQQAELAYRAGAGTLTDVFDARARVKLADAALIRERQQVEYARRNLAALTGRYPERLAPLDVTAMGDGPTATESLEQWLARAEAANPLIESQRHAVEAARREIEKAAAGHHPTLDLVASLQKASSESAVTINTDYRTRSLGVQLNVPLFAGGYVVASEDQAQANLDKAMSQLDATRRAVGLEVRKAYDGIIQGRARLRALEEAMHSAEESLRGTQKGMRAGTRTLVDLLDAERRVFEVSKELAQARYALILSFLQLKSLAGDLDERTLEHVNGWLQTPDK